MASLTERDRALCSVAEKLSAQPTRIVEEDWKPLRDLGFDDEALLEVAHVVGLFNYLTRLADGLGLRLDPETMQAGITGAKLSERSESGPTQGEADSPMTTSDARAAKLRELQPYIERARTFSGWTFGVGPKPLEPGPPWDYEQVAREYALRAHDVLDMGTGGGEVLSRVIEGTTARVVATEHWHVNAPIARDRLAPFGAQVVRANNLRLPFREASFDLVLNRHEELEPADVVRVLRPGGAIVTQQVGRRNWDELREFFPRKTVWPDHFNQYQRAFRTAGMHVEAQEHHWRMAYGSLGDVVFMMLIAPWEIEGFDPVAEIDQLLALEAKHRTAEGIELTESRYLIVASTTERS